MLLLACGTGLVGRPIIDCCARLPGSKRLLTRVPVVGAIPAEFEVHLNLASDAAAIERAFQGVEVAILIPKIEGNLIESHRALLACAKRSGVERIVLLSLVGAHKTSCVRVLRWLGVVEQEALELGLKVTVVRTAPLMQNLLLFARGPNDCAGMVAPFHDARLPWLDARDLARALATLAQSHGGKSVITLTGPQRLAFDDVARLVAAHTGKDYSYVDVSMCQARGRLEAAGLDAIQVLALTQWWDALISGYVEIQDSKELQHLLGRPPTAMEQFVADHASEFCPLNRTTATLAPSESVAAARIPV